MDEPTVSVAPVTAPTTATRMRMAGLEGPRGLGAVCIILAHVAVVYTPSILETTRLDFLGQALTFFFVLSGFLLYLPYVTRFVASKPLPSTKKYYAGRVRRVFPAYLVIFLLVNFVLGAAYVSNPVVGGWDHSDEGTGTITDPLDLLAHLTLTQTLFPSTLQTGINPAWSLTTELGFYLILPLAAFLLFRFAGGRGNPLVMALIPAGVLLVVGLVTGAVVAVLRSNSPLSPLESAWGPNWIAVLSRSFLALADNFAWGMVAAVVYVAILEGAFRRTTTRRLLTILTTIMLVALAGSLGAFVLGSHLIASIFAIASCALILMIVAPAGRGERSWLPAVTDWAPLKFIGMISLSTYLWHYPVLIMVGRTGIAVPDTAAGLLWATALVAAITVALGATTYYVVEKPMMSWRVARKLPG